MRPAGVCDHQSVARTDDRISSHRQFFFLAGGYATRRIGIRRPGAAFFVDVIETLWRQPIRLFHEGERSTLEPHIAEVKSSLVARKEYVAVQLRLQVLREGVRDLNACFAMRNGHGRDGRNFRAFDGDQTDQS